MTIKKIRETNGTDHFLAAKYDDSGNIIINTYETKTDATAKLNKKANDYSLEIYNGTGGNPKPVKFMTVNYSTCGSENGVAVKLGLVSGHGNGTSYAFLEDVIVRVSYLGNVEVDNFKYYGASTGTYDGAERQYGDIFWVIDTTNKIVDFYVLMGQYARIQMIPAKRVTYSTGGTITQHTSCTVYSSGTKNWANNSEIATKNDIPLVNSDWNQNDETALDYIKNRPFYVEEATMVPLIDNLTFSPDFDNYWLTEQIQLVDGKDYDVIWNEQTYHLSCVKCNDLFIIGNPSFVNVWTESYCGDDNGLPFAILGYEGNECVILTTQTNVTMSLLTEGDLIHKIDEKFLPDLVGKPTEADGAEIFNNYLHNVAWGRFSHAEGNKCSASGDYSHAEGDSTKAEGEASHAEGDSTKAIGNYSHAEGQYSDANGEASHAEGSGTADGWGSHAEGASTYATGDYSHAEGQYSKAIGKASHAEGKYSHAEGDYSHAEGQYILAYGNSQHVQGKYNIGDQNERYCHIVGNGTDTRARSNAHTLDWGGNAWFAGNVYVGGTSQDDGVKLITQNDIVNEDTSVPISFLKNGKGGILSWLWVTGSDGNTDYVLAPKGDKSGTKYDAYLGDASTPFLGLYTGFVDATGMLQTTGNIYAKGANSIVQAKKQVYSEGVLTADGNCNIGGITTITQRLVPAKTNNVNLGLSDARWLGIYSSSAVNVSSDLTVKTDLSEIDDRYMELFDLVQPYAYKFIDGTSGRYHTGFISQYVEEAMKKVGLKDTDLAFFCKDAMYEYVKDEDGNIIEQKPVLDEEGNQKYFYSLRYEEYIAIMVEKMKRMEKRINELEAKQEKLNTLEKEMVEIKSLLKSKNS